MLQDPLFIIAALACGVVAVILLMGISQFGKDGVESSKRSNTFMRWRIIAQFVAILLILAFVLIRGEGGVKPMVVLSKIYTKTGDAGETALGNGARVAKHSIRVSAYGTVDEVNAMVGLARLKSTDDEDPALARIQNDLFDLGADLCRPDMDQDAEAGYTPLRVTPAQVARLEAEIDEMNAKLQPLHSFILPGGSELAAALHLCRTVVRRAERLTVELAMMEAINPDAVKYLNRLSDWFFVASRIANNNGAADVLWVPGANR